MKRAVFTSGAFSFKFLRGIYAFIEAIKETSFFSDPVCSVLEVLNCKAAFAHFINPISSLAVSTSYRL